RAGLGGRPYTRRPIRGPPGDCSQRVAPPARHDFTGAAAHCRLESRTSRDDWTIGRECMNQFQRYLLDEFVEDYRAGQMSRREFVMKVIGVSGGLAAAMGLFSSVGLSG